MILGRLGEKYARDYLVRCGLRYVRSNWRSRTGEIDLIFIDKQELVFIEVKTRKAGDERYLFAALDNVKQQRLRRLAESFIAQNFSGRAAAARIDVIGVVVSSDLSLRALKHLKAVC